MGATWGRGTGVGGRGTGGGGPALGAGRVAGSECDPVNHSDPFGLCVDGISTIACLYAAFEVGATAYDLYDLGRTAYRYAQGRESGAALGVTAAGVGAGVVGFGGGYGRMARAAMNSLDDLSSAAMAADRGGLTKAGRELAKHGGRDGSAFPKVGGRPADKNRAGQQIVDDILSNPGSRFNARHHARFGDVIEVRAPDGRGVRYSSNRDFLGFLEPNK